MFRNLSLSTFNLLNPLVVSVLVLLLWTSSILHQRHTFQQLMEAVGGEYMESRKQLVLDMVANAAELIAMKKSLLEARVRANLQTRVDEAYRIVESLYTLNRGHASDAEIQRAILPAVEFQTSGAGGENCFIFTLEGVELLPMTGRGSGSQPDAAEKAAVLEDTLRIARKAGQGFSTCRPKEPGETVPEGSKRISFVRVFEPYRWVIGSSDYPGDTLTEIQEELFQWVDQIRFSAGGYMWIIDTDLSMLVHPLKKQTEVPDWYRPGGLWNRTDQRGRPFFRELRDICLGQGSCYFEYVWEKPEERGSYKSIAYAELIPEWGWIVCAGISLDHMEETIRHNAQLLEKMTGTEIMNLSVTSILLLIILMSLTHFFHKQVYKAFRTFRDHFKEATSSLTEIEPAELYFDDFKRLAAHVNKMVSDQRATVSHLKSSEERLLQSQKLEAIGRFAGGIAHDFGNLMMVVHGNTEMLLWNSIIPEQARDVLKEILQASEKASALTHRLLVFSRRQTLHPVLIDLSRLVSDLGDILRRIIGEDISLITESAPDLGLIKADPVHIEQIVINLALNARDAMPRGGLLRISTRNVSLDDRTGQPSPSPAHNPGVLLEIADTGQGMDADIQMHLFEPFFTTKAMNQGTGLGLSTVYGIVKQSGGEIAVSSEPGRGSTFSITFSRTMGEAPENAAIAELPLDQGAGETILLVEDELHVREVIAASLRRFGYCVLEAGDGIEALNFLWRNRSLRIDLIITDIIMPGMGGDELLARLPARYAGTAVLFMSGYPGTMTIGNKAFIQKPFSSQALLAKIQELLIADRPVPR